jgi:Predicted hydrolases of HD superfamily
MMLTDLLAISHVPRWSIVPHHPMQTVAAHSHRVAVIYLELCRRLKKDPSLRGLTWAIVHDGPESRTGDIPGVFKREVNGELEKAERRVCAWFDDALLPPPADKLLVKVADLVETFTYIRYYGIGPHARLVGDRIWQQLDVLLAATDWMQTVRVLVDDILTDAGRIG